MTQPLIFHTNHPILWLLEVSRLTPAIQHLPLGLPASVRCSVDANPAATFVNWAKEGRVIDTRNADSRFSVDDHGAMLLFDVVQKNDAGVYTCQAYNSVGGSNPFEVHVLVQGTQTLPIHLSMIGDELGGFESRRTL